MQIIKPDVNIDFVGSRKIAYVVSCIMILACIVSLVAHGGPKYGIDFAGGAEVLVQLDQPVGIEKVKAALAGIGIEGSTVQAYGQGKGDNYRILVPADQTEPPLQRLGRVSAGRDYRAPKIRRIVRDRVDDAIHGGLLVVLPALIARQTTAKVLTEQARNVGAGRSQGVVER